MSKLEGRWQRAEGSLASKAWLAVFTASCLLPSARCFADATHIKDEDDGSLTIIRMEVTPADEAVPTFKHRLVCDLNDRVLGNRPQWYLRAYPEERTAWRYWTEQMRQDDEAFDEMYRSGTPVSEVDWGQYDKARRAARGIVGDYVVPGSRRRDCEWNFHAESLRGPDVLAFLLPEIQGMRAMARMGSLATREAIADERYDDALAYLGANYQLGRDVAEEPFLVCGLVGIAIAGITNGGTIDLIAAPNSPNLYWALSEFSTPPISLSHAMQFELGIGPRLYPFLQEDETNNRTPEQWNADWKRWAQYVDDNAYMAQAAKPPAVPPLQRFFPMLTGLSGYTHAKSRLIDWGRTPEEIEQMSVGEVLSKYSAAVYRRLCDKQWQAYLTPYAQHLQRSSEAEEYLNENRVLSDGVDREVIAISSTWLPALQAARSAEVRCARDVAALRVIEALRMHAARNNGKWPRSLDEVTCVPIPLNPATDKPFLYHRDGRTAVLELPDWEGFPGFSRRYEITIAAAAE